MAYSFGDLQQLPILLFYSDSKIQKNSKDNNARNNQLYNDLDILSVEEEIKRYGSNYIDSLKYHINSFARDLTSTIDEVRRLQRYHPIDLALIDF